VQVIGHQWWWEFRYPQYNVTTANELYVQEGRPVVFELSSVDVIHSFWVPALGGKRDLISGKTNTLWFTPDSTGEASFIGSCNEYCGSSHANMKFRAFTVSAANFESWAQHQAANAVYPPPPPAPAAGATAVPTANTGAPTQPPAAPAATTSTSTGFAFPADKLGAHVIPSTPIPASIRFNEALLASGDAQRGFETYSRSVCIGCHAVRGNPMSRSPIGPDLTHLASRHTIAGGLFPNDAKHLAYWLKNAVAMKPGAKMQVVGLGEIDATTKRPVSTGGLTDEQIADIVAYLRSLK
jgi:cytochrome c oxidase subunit 2